MVLQQKIPVARSIPLVSRLRPRRRRHSTIQCHLLARRRELTHDLRVKYVLTLAGGMAAGTQTVWASLMRIPNSVLNAATGVPESTFSELKKYPLVIAPGTGGESCLAKCGLNFKSVRAPASSARIALGGTAPAIE